MVNEEIIRVFLKQRRSLTAFRKNRKSDNSYYKKYSNVPVKYAVLKAFDWNSTEKSAEHWTKLHDDLVQMCKVLRISGEVELDKI